MSLSLLDVEDFSDLYDEDDDDCGARSWRDTLYDELGDDPRDLEKRLHAASPRHAEEIVEVAGLYCDPASPDGDVYSFDWCEQEWELEPTVTGPWRRHCWRRDEALFRTRLRNGSYLWERARWDDGNEEGKLPPGWQVPNDEDGLRNRYR